MNTNLNANVSNLSNYISSNNKLKLLNLNNHKSNKLRLLKPKLDASNCFANPNLLNFNLNLNVQQDKINNTKNITKEVKNKFIPPEKKDIVEILKNYPKLKLHNKMGRQIQLINESPIENLVNLNSNSKKNEFISKDNLTHELHGSQFNSSKEMSPPNIKKIKNLKNNSHKLDSITSTNFNKNFVKIKRNTLNNNETLLNNTFHGHAYNHSFENKSQNKYSINHSINLNDNHQLNLLKNRQKSMKSKETGIKIIDEIINGLTKLKTIIAEDNINTDVNRIIEQSFKRTIEVNNNLLVSSFTGEEIGIKNKKNYNLTKNKNINHKTIVYDESTIKPDDDIYINTTNNTTNNDSLIMKIGTDKKSFIKDRYSHNYQKININESFRAGSHIKRNVTPNIKMNKGNILRDVNISDINNKNLNLKYTVENGETSKDNKTYFGIDKFEFKVVRNKDKEFIFNNKGLISLNKNNSSYLEKNKTTELPKKLLDLKIINQDEDNWIKNITYENDELANYQFID